MARLRDAGAVVRKIGVLAFVRRVWTQVDEDNVFAWASSLSYSWILALFPFLIFLPLRLPAWLVLGFWFALQAVYSSGHGVSGTGTVAYSAHIVGFVAGLLLALPLRPGTPPPPEPRSLLFGRQARPRHTW